MKYLLDTNICIYIIKKKPISVLHRLKKEKISQVGISSISLGELQYGVEKSNFPKKNKLALFEFLSPLEIYSFDQVAALKYGRVRADLEKRGKVIGSYNMLIAAHAISLKLTLVSNNLKEFNRVKDLKIENWI